MRCPANRRFGVRARFLWGGVALAVLMLGALAQPASAQLRAPNISVDEGKVAVFKITLPRNYKRAIRYAYQTRDASARKGRHYMTGKGHIVFPAGTRNAQVKVQTRVSPDRVTRTFKLELYNKQVFEDNEWNAAWAIIFARGIPRSKTIYARIRDTVGGMMGPE